MKVLIRLGVLIKKAVVLMMAIVCVVLIFWGILYKLFLAFTPQWLDEFTIVAVPLALLVVWLMGKAEEPDADEKDVKPAPAVSDAAAQLAQDGEVPAASED